MGITSISFEEDIEETILISLTVLSTGLVSDINIYSDVGSAESALLITEHIVQNFQKSV